MIHPISILMRRIWRYGDQSRFGRLAEKEFVGGTATYNDMQASVSGGTRTIQYRIGANYHKETAVFPGDGADEKGSAHFSITGKFTESKIQCDFNR